MTGSNIIPAVVTFVALTAQVLQPLPQSQTMHALATHTMPMADRYAVPQVNNVFKDNILLTIAYMKGSTQNTSHIDWHEIEKPFHYEFILQPHENFAFHDTVLAPYKEKISQTTNAHFDFNEGFKSDGYLFGDGVCHLASILNWVAQDAGLETIAPSNHDFAKIPDVPKEYGVAIFTDPSDASESAKENLYITNNKDKPVTFAFDYKENILTVSAFEQN